MEIAKADHSHVRRQTTTPSSRTRNSTEKVLTSFPTRTMLI